MERNNLNFRIIGFVGKRGCGKDACSKYLLRKYGVKEIVMSEFINKAVQLFHIPPNRKNIPWFITKIRKRFGKGILAHAVVKRIRDNGSAIYTINGIRLKREVEILRDEYNKKFILVDITCDAKIRFERIKKREKKTKQRKDETDMPLVDFLKQEKRIVTEKEISAIEKKADYVIENNGTKKELFKRLNELVLKKLKIPSSNVK